MKDGDSKGYQVRALRRKGEVRGAAQAEGQAELLDSD